MTDNEKYQFILNNKVTLIPEVGYVDGVREDQYRIIINGRNMSIRNLDKAIESYVEGEKK